MKVTFISKKLLSTIIISFLIIILTSEVFSENHKKTSKSHSSSKDKKHKSRSHNHSHTNNHSHGHVHSDRKFIIQFRIF